MIRLQWPPAAIEFVIHTIDKSLAPAVEVEPRVGGWIHVCVGVARAKIEEAANGPFACDRRRSPKSRSKASRLNAALGLRERGLGRRQAWLELASRFRRQTYGARTRDVGT